MFFVKSNTWGNLSAYDGVERIRDFGSESEPLNLWRAVIWICETLAAGNPVRVDSDRVQDEIASLGEVVRRHGIGGPRGG